MGSVQQNQDQQHPQYHRDREIVNKLLSTSQPDEENLADLARLKIRYRFFPGARDIQADLEKAMQKWGYTEETLYEITRKIHQEGKVYRRYKTEQEDWI